MEATSLIDPENTWHLGRNDITCFGGLMRRIAVFEPETNRECQNSVTKPLPPQPASSPSRVASRRLIQCDHCACEHHAVCLIELRFLCMHHFVAYCYQRLAEYENESTESSNPDCARRFFRECAAQATKLSLIGYELQNIDRARLLDIVLWANDLFGRSILKSTGFTSLTRNGGIADAAG
jgi:hypothetical protein